MMDVGQEITVADLRACLQKQNMQEADIKEGDAVFFNTGFGELWMKNNDKFNSGEPGIGHRSRQVVRRQGHLPDRRRYLGDRGRAQSRQEPGVPGAWRAALPRTASSTMRTWTSRRCWPTSKYQFVYIFSPAPIKGATGSNGGPIAVT